MQALLDASCCSAVSGGPLLDNPSRKSGECCRLEKCPVPTTILYLTRFYASILLLFQNTRFHSLGFENSRGSCAWLSTLTSLLLPIEASSFPVLCVYINMASSKPGLNLKLYTWGYVPTMDRAVYPHAAWHLRCSLTAVYAVYIAFIVSCHAVAKKKPGKGGGSCHFEVSVETTTSRAA
jgi:hypothetical protein